MIRLHVTSTGAAAQNLAAAGLGGEVLAWRDVLQEGPVPAGVTPEELDVLRARYIASRGYAPHQSIHAGIVRRNAALREAGAVGEVTLWFAHAPLDLLQLAQAIWSMADWRGALERTSLVLVHELARAPRFSSIGQLLPDEYRERYAGRRPLAREQVDACLALWADFRRPDPTGLVPWMRRSVASLPHLAACVTRLLQELPWTRDGLSRTQREILQCVDAGASAFPAMMARFMLRERPAYQGDADLWSQVLDLASGPRPLLSVTPDAGPADALLSLTPWASAVLAGEAGEVPPLEVDRWLGGTHLRSGRSLWLWDEAAHSVVAVP